MEILIGLIVVVIVIAVILAIWLISAYNGLIRKKNNAEEAWSGIHTQERSRLDTIEQLMGSVKGYTKHENEISMAFASARGALNDAQNGDVKNLEKAQQSMDQAMVNIQAVSEAYPDLKANENFLQLQDEITRLERQIAAARRRYNNSVQEFNTTRQSFPTNIIAGMIGFKEDFEYFEFDEEVARVAPTVDFS